MEHQREAQTVWHCLATRSLAVETLTTVDHRTVVNHRISSSGYPFPRAATTDLTYRKLECTDLSYISVTELLLGNRRLLQRPFLVSREAQGTEDRRLFESLEETRRAHFRDRHVDDGGMSGVWGKNSKMDLCNLGFRTANPRRVRESLIRLGFDQAYPRKGLGCTPMSTAIPTEPNRAYT
ncbi:hypothetical protein Moror_11441 [Moniliophthora roreri MCA 2997]|uniref:Uncharacterized protein n=1 Tax=Moniliophthora roreri (strain MCA 2997) TaxID=1381753 RepID=V2XXG8_MONRO|nr:hypothetical protein Moror_11441 [Moniliophthora roreri MCA 2997]